MPSINMIAPRRAEKLRRERDMKRLMIVIAAELFIVAALAGWGLSNLLATSRQVSQLNKEIDKLQPIVEEIKQYDVATSKLQPKLKLLDDAKGVTLRWYNTLNTLSQSLPQSTFLMKIGVQSDQGSGGKEKAEKINIILSGISASQALVGETMLRIQGIPDLSNVSLHYTKDSELPDMSASNLNGSVKLQAVEFEIGTTLKLSDAKGAGKNGPTES